MKVLIARRLVTFAGAFLVIAIFPILAFGHCDTMDGPVVKAAKMALRTKNVNYVLIWVHEKEEAEIRSAFTKVSRVRRLGREARDLADLYFFETVVRLHRAGEGEPYTGLKASGTEDMALFVEIDKAIDKNSVSALTARFPADEKSAIEERFLEVISKKKFGVNDVAAGRRFVESYVTFLHMVEKIAGHSDA